VRASRSTLAQLALHAGACALQAALGAVASGGPAALEALEVTLDLALGRLEAAIRTCGLGDRLDHRVTRHEGGADGDEEGALGEVLGLLDRRALVELARCGGAAGGCAPAPGVGAACGGSAASRGALSAGGAHEVSLSFEGVELTDRTFGPG
jgi:hypothetical protein